MTKKNNNLTSDLITEDKLNEYSTADLDYVMAHSPLNKNGYPDVIPHKNRLGRNVLLSFYHAQIKSPDGKPLDDEIATFDILEIDSFDKSAPDAATKAKFLAALLSMNRFVDGGVYFRGEYYTKKMTKHFASVIGKHLMEHYFHIEDGEYIQKYFDKMEGGLLPFWPEHFYDGKREAVFSAVNATITNPESKEESPEIYNFNVLKGEIFDLTKKEDIKRVNAIKTLFNKNRVVKGFYYKGELLNDHLSEDFRLYLEKTFIKKNFVVEQADFVMANVTKDKKSGYPLFWPMRNKEGKEIAISVVNADVTNLGLDDKYSRFDIYADKSFDLTQVDNQNKLKVVQALYSKKTVLDGALYLDGMLIPGNLIKSEIIRRKDKAEDASGIYIDDNEDFLRINREFTVEDRDKLLQLTKTFDDYYTDNVTLIPKKDKNYDRNSNVVYRFDRVNAVSSHGDLELKKDLSLDIHEGDTYETLVSEDFDIIARAVIIDDIKIRGAIYYKGKNIAQKKHSHGFKELKKYILSIFPEEKVRKAEEDHVQRFKYDLDKKTGMLKYWPTVDKNGREVLLSVVRADVYFGSGRRQVKANQHLNFDIYVGETFGLVGESGSGKTTISRAILGINHLTHGAIYFKGRLISTKLNKTETKKTKKNIQMIFQDPSASLNERANIDYIVSEGLYNFHMFKSKEERLEKVTNMMTSVGLLPEHLSRYPHEFSGGQRQRIGIARALIVEPELVLADEPISALDVSIRAQVLNLLKKLQNERDLTYLFIAHDLSIIRYISDRIAVMHRGHIVELGKAEDIYAHPIHPYTRALLTAIPQPDPKSKNDRKKLVYTKGDLDYDKCSWIQVKPGHFILATPELAKDWAADKIDPKFLKEAGGTINSEN